MRTRFVLSTTLIAAACAASALVWAQQDKPAAKDADCPMHAEMHKDGAKHDEMHKGMSKDKAHAMHCGKSGRAMHGAGGMHGKKGMAPEASAKDGKDAAEHKH